MAAGDGALNAGYAVTFPADNGEKLKQAAYFEEQHQRQLDRDAERQKAEDAHKFALQKYYGDQFDPSKFDTKTALDESINGYLSKGHQAVSDAIQQGVDGADLEKIMQQSLSPAVNLYQKGSLVKANIDNTVAALKDDKGIDTDTFRKEASLRAFFNKDANGKYTIKSDDEIKQIDPEHDYFQDIDPSLLYKGGGTDVEGKLAKLPVANFKSSGAYYSSPGVKRKGSFDASYFQGAQKLTQEPDGTYKVETADNPIQTKDDKGNAVTIHQIPDEVLSHFSQTVSERMGLDIDTKKYAAEHGLPDIKPRTQVFEQMKKAMLYDKLNSMAPKRISQSHDVTTAPIVIKQQLFPGYDPRKASGYGQPVHTEAPSFNKITGTKLYSPLMGNNVEVGDVKDGQVTGNIPMGATEAKIKIEDLPEEYRSAAHKLTSDNDITGDVEGRKKKPTGYVTVKIYDKQIVGLKTDKGSVFTADNLGELWDKENNATVPMKEKTHPHEAPKKQKVNW